MPASYFEGLQCHPLKSTRKLAPFDSQGALVALLLSNTNISRPAKIKKMVVDGTKRTPESSKHSSKVIVTGSITGLLHAIIYRRFNI
jgi:hypothetical protein